MAVAVRSGGNDSFTLVGVESMRARMIDLAKQMPDRAARATYEEMLLEEKESRRRTPVDTGALEGSHVTERPVISAGIIQCRILVGGPAASYAWFVHENLEAHHRIGQAKFLESTLRESAPYMAGRIARRMKL